MLGHPLFSFQTCNAQFSRRPQHGTELAADVIDWATQAHGAMGMTKELPLQLMAQRVRVMRIYEGPSEAHRWVLARNRLREGK
jgi:acyl-CoA dehydrogenase